MKYVKMLGLAVAAVAAFMAFVGAGSASATALCSSNSTPCGASKLGVGTEIKSSLVAGTEARLHAGFAEITCAQSTVNGKIEHAGSATEDVSGKISSLTFGSCSGKVVVKKAGSLSIHYTGEMNGTVSSTGAEVEVEQIGVSCTYGTPTTKTIGPLKGGSPAKLTAEAELTKIAGGFLCASPAHWEAQYQVSSPNPLFVAES